MCSGLWGDDSAPVGIGFWCMVVLHIGWSIEISICTARMIMVGFGANYTIIIHIDGSTPHLK
jgi:hypothetical protein